MEELDGLREMAPVPARLAQLSAGHITVSQLQISSAQLAGVDFKEQAGGLRYLVARVPLLVPCSPPTLRSIAGSGRIALTNKS